MPFTTLLTNTGITKLANAISTGTPLPLLQMAVGDGNGNPITPAATMTTLVRQRFIGPISRAIPDPNTAGQMIFDLQIPAASGGWTIHEVGLFDNAGALIAIASFPPTYKPAPSEGSTSDLTVRIYVKISNASSVTVTVDPAVVIASQQWVIDNFSKAALFPGGTTGQLLRKKTNAGGDTEWADPFTIQVIVNVRKEVQTLAASQTIVDLAVCTTVGLAVYIEGIREEGWTAHPTITTRLTLDRSYPTGTQIYFFQNDPTNQADLVTRDGATLKNGANLNFAGGGTVGGLPAPTSGSQAANKDYVDSVLAGGKMVGEVFMHAGTPPTVGSVEYIVCDGRALDRTTYATLFAALGGNSTAWGAPNTSQFYIPDLRGRSPIGAGAGTGLTARSPGNYGGAETHTLTVPEMPSHNHALGIQYGTPDNYLNGIGGARFVSATTLTTNTTGGSQPHNNMQPFAAIQFFIRAK